MRDAFECDGEVRAELQCAEAEAHGDQDDGDDRHETVPAVAGNGDTGRIGTGVEMGHGNG